jgi:hypothetical protein
MDDGEAVKLLIVGEPAGPAPATKTVVLCVTVSDPLVAVSVYSVVTAGVTIFDPVAATLPTFGVIETVPLETFQLSVEVWPAVTAHGVALNELTMGVDAPQPLPVQTSADRFIV